MSGDRFVDTPRGPAFAALMELTKPVTEILIEQGMCPAIAGFVAGRCIEAVFRGLDGGSVHDISVTELLTWGSEDFGCRA